MVDVCLYTSPLGDTFNLNDQTSFFVQDFGGQGIVPPKNWFQELPIADGAIYTGSRYEKRRLDVFMVLKSDTYAGRRELEQRLTRALAPIRYRAATGGTASAGTLTLSAGESALRVIDAVYAGGLELGSNGRLGPAARKLVVSFDCPSVYFRTVQPTTLNFANTAGTAPKMNSAYTHIYDGTGPSYPIVVLTGPATNPYIQVVGPDGVTRVVGLSYVLASLSTITFDFRSGHKSIRLNASTTNTDLRPYLTTVSGSATDFWALQEGTNTITLYDAAGSPTSTATFQFYPAYGSL